MGKESKTVTVPEREQQHLQATHETTRGTPVGANLPFKAMARLQRVAGNQAIGSLLGGGQPLPDGIRGEMQQRFGVDFSQVRVHDHAQAHAAASGLKAKAFTYGNDVVFGAGHYMPETLGGRRLLSHELAHVIQQRRGGAAPQLGEDSALEQAADRAADAVASNGAPVAVAGATSVGIACDKDDDELRRLRAAATQYVAHSHSPIGPPPASASSDGVAPVQLVAPAKGPVANPSGLVSADYGRAKYKPSARPADVMPGPKADVELPLPGPEALKAKDTEIGRVARHRHQTDMGTDISEHGQPGAQWRQVSTDPKTAQPIYDDAAYEADITIRSPGTTANWKTHKGPLSDNKRTDAIKAKIAKGERVDLTEDIVLPSIEQQWAANAATGRPLTDEQIVAQQMAQYGEKFDMTPGMEAGDRIRAQRRGTTIVRKYQERKAKAEASSNPKKVEAAKQWLEKQGGTLRNRSDELAQTGKAVKNAGITDVDWEGTFSAPKAPAARPRLGPRMRAGLKSGAWALGTMLAFMGLAYLGQRAREQELDVALMRARRALRGIALRMLAAQPGQSVYFRFTIRASHFDKYMPVVGWLPEDTLGIWAAGVTTEPMETPKLASEEYGAPTSLGSLMNPGNIAFLTYTEPFDPAAEEVGGTP